MSELEPSLRRVASIWWLFLWRGGVGGAILGGLAGGVIGIAGALLGATREDVASISGIPGALAGFCWSFFVMRMALRKRYRDFRIALLSPQSRAEVFD